MMIPPQGMIASNWGGTPVEAWSSPDALKKCGLNTTGGVVGRDRGEHRYWTVRVELSVFIVKLMTNIHTNKLKIGVWFQVLRLFFYCLNS